MESLTTRKIARMIDHAVLKPNSTLAEVEAACRLCARYEVGSICVRPSDVPAAASLLYGTTTAIGTVIGFPHGTTSTAGKTAEAEQAFRDGCAEVDMVLNIGRLLSDNLAFVEADIQAVLDVTRKHNRLLKVIFETCYLSDAQKIAACGICSRLGVDFVKTSTGFGSGGATFADVHLMRSHCPDTIQVKASGGIRDLDAALAFIACGATRLGTSATERIILTALTRESEGVLKPLSLQDALRYGNDDPAKAY